MGVTGAFLSDFTKSFKTGAGERVGERHLNQSYHQQDHFKFYLMRTIQTLKHLDATLRLACVSISAGRCALWAVWLSGAMAVMSPSSVSGTQSVTLAWNPVNSPNVAGYNLYYGPASGNYTNITSVGNVTNVTISGLTEGATYYFATTTLSTSGLESTYSSEISYTVPSAVPLIQVNPGSISYGTVCAGTSVTNSFTVKNAGTGLLSGSATVSAPFNVVSGGSYSLGAGQTQLVTVTFSPLVASNNNQIVSLNNQIVSFSGGGGTSVMVSGIATNPPVRPPLTVITERITANITNPITLQYCTNMSSQTWWTAGTFAGSTNCSFTNLPAVFIRGLCSNLSSSVTLTWPASTSPSMVGYKVYYGTASGVYSSVLNVGKVTTATVSNLTAGQRYYFLVDTYSALGASSPYMSETSAIPPATSFSLVIGH